jgi:hypothetical protein
VSRSTLSVIEKDSQVLHLVDCNAQGSSSEEFQFNLVDDIERKRIELHALGKSGFNVAIGPIQSENSINLGRTVTIKLNNS